MPIAKGQPWGVPRPLPQDGVVVRSDAEARAVVTAARREGAAVPTLGLLAGDLCRTLGGLGDEARLRSADAMTFPVDLGAVLIDGRLHWFVAHLVARHRAWRGRTVAAMNAQWIGGWNVGPRAHPNDGLLDVYEAEVPLSQLAAVGKRLRTGSHLPHPGIREQRRSAVQVELPRPTPVLLDGHSVGRARSLSLRVEPDALQVVV